MPAGGGAWAALGERPSLREPWFCAVAERCAPALPPSNPNNKLAPSAAAQVRSRVGHKVLDGGKKVRYLVKTGEVLVN